MGRITYTTGFSRYFIGECTDGIIYSGTGVLKTSVGRYSDGCIYRGVSWLDTVQVGCYQDGVIYSGNGLGRITVGEYRDGIVYEGYGVRRTKIGEYESSPAEAAALLLLREELMSGSSGEKSEIADPPAPSTSGDSSGGSDGGTGGGTGIGIIDGIAGFGFVVIAIVIGFLLSCVREALADGKETMRILLLYALPALCFLVTAIVSASRDRRLAVKGLIDGLTTAAVLFLSLYLGIYVHWICALVLFPALMLLLPLFYALDCDALPDDARKVVHDADRRRCRVLIWGCASLLAVFNAVLLTSDFVAFLLLLLVSVTVAIGIASNLVKAIAHLDEKDLIAGGVRSPDGKALVRILQILALVAAAALMIFGPSLERMAASAEPEVSAVDSGMDAEPAPAVVWPDEAVDPLAPSDDIWYPSEQPEPAAPAAAESKDLVTLAESRLSANYNGDDNSIGWDRGAVRDAYRNEYDGYLVFSVSSAKSSPPSITLDLGGEDKVLDVWCFVAGWRAGRGVMGGHTNAEEELGLRFYADDRQIWDTGGLSSLDGAQELHLDLSGAQTLRIELYGVKKSYGSPTRAYLSGAVRSKDAPSALPAQQEPQRPDPASLVDLAKQYIASNWSAGDNVQDCSTDSCKDAKGNKYSGYLVFEMYDAKGSAPWYLLDLGGAYKSLDLTCFVADRYGKSWGPDKELGLRFYADDRLICDTGLLHGDMDPKTLHLDVSGAKTLKIEAYTGDKGARHSSIFIVDGSLSKS